MFQIGILPIVQDHRDRALAWGGSAGPWKANVWLSQHTFGIKS